jgi:hypothetical protein
MDGSGVWEIFYPLARILAIGGGILLGIICLSVLWLCFSGKQHKKA